MSQGVTTRALRVGLAALMAAALAQAAPEPVRVASFDQTGGQPVVLDGVWLRAEPGEGTGARPAVLLLHGCGGLYAGRAGAGSRPLDARFVDVAARLNALGVHVLALDAFTARGETELCTQKIGTRAVTQRHRRLDALGGLLWMAGQPGVDPARLGLVGWSNGGSTVLAATQGRRAEVREASHRASLAVAYYPGCETELKAGYEATAPLLLLVGAEDDWTPAAPCRELAAAARGAPVEIALYPGAYHGFDGTAPLRLRRDVPNGARPGQGVHAGAHAPSREASRERLIDFVKQQWRLP